MSRIAPTVAKMMLFFCAGSLALTLAGPAGSGEVRAQPNFEFDDFNNQPAGRDPSPAEVMIVLAFYGVIIAVGLAIHIFITFLLWTLLKAVPQQFRLMEPGMVWLMLIPLFSIVWMFFVYIRIAKSYQNYFRSMGRYDVGDCGESLGLWYCCCVCMSVIPCVGAIAGMAAFVLMIIYLVKLFGLKSQIQVGQAGFAQPKWGPQM